MAFNEIVLLYWIWMKPLDELEFSDDFNISNDLFKSVHGSKEVVKIYQFHQIPNVLLFSLPFWGILF
jgi:hypothetical protein